LVNQRRDHYRAVPPPSRGDSSPNPSVNLTCTVASAGTAPGLAACPGTMAPAGDPNQDSFYFFSVAHLCEAQK